MNLKKDTNIDTILDEETTSVYQRICEYYFNILHDDVSKMYDNDGVSLCAKWFVSENSKLDRRIKFTKYFCKFNKISQGYLRKHYLSPLRKHIKIIEHCLTDKSINNFSVSDLGTIPSQAKLKYKKVLSNVPEWNNYLETLKRMMEVLKLM